MNAPAAQPAASVSWARVAWICLPFAYLLSAAFHVAFGAMNADEGFYAIAARSVMEGDLPYRDFGYTQTPLLPFVNGPLLSLTGFGLFAQRALNGFWTLVALGLAAAWVARRSRGWIAALLVASFTATPAWMYYSHLGKTYAFTTLAALAAAGVFVFHRGGGRKQAWLGLIGTIGVGCRLPSAPFFAVLWLAALWHDGPPDRRRVAVGGASLLLAALGLLVPFYVLAPEQCRFWMFDFHRISVPDRLWRADPLEVAGLAPAAWLATLVVVGAWISRRTWAPTREMGVIAASAAALAPNLVPRGIYVEYGVPFMLPLAAASAIELFRLARSWPATPRRWLVGALALAPMALVPAMILASGRRQPDAPAWALLLPPNVSYAPDLPARLARAREQVEQVVRPSEPLLGPNIILAAETGRAVPRAARMGPFSMTADFDRATARRLNLLTYSDLQDWLGDPHVRLLAFFTTPRANYAWSVPSFRLQARDEAERWLAGLRREFVVVQQDSDFLLVVRRPAGN